MSTKIRLGVAFPSCNIGNKIIEHATKKLHSYDIILEIVSNHDSLQTPFRNTPEERAREIEELFLRSDINAIICARGGFGAQHVAQYLNYDIIKKNPKIFIGYSDLTILLNKIYLETGIITYHGVMLNQMVNIRNPSFFENFYSLLSGKLLKLTKSGTLSSLNILKSGEAVGRLVGGNLTSICTTIGTKYEISFKNSILFLEDVGEELYKIDRSITMLWQTGKIQSCSAIILGNFSDIPNKTSIIYNHSLTELLTERLKEFKGPIISQYPAGHKDYTNYLPIGRECKLHANNEIILQFT